MVPFLEHGFVDVLHTLMKMVVKSDVLDQANSILKLSKLDLSNSENLLPCQLMSHSYKDLITHYIKALHWSIKWKAAIFFKECQTNDCYIGPKTSGMLPT